MEIERKFTVETMPENLEQYSCHEIEQAYLCTSPVIRIRKQDDDYYLTYKGSGLMIREEYNLPLTREAYEHLKEKADGKIITKKRYLIPLPNPDFSTTVPHSTLEDLNLTIELDLFTSPSNLVLAEVEFPSEQLAKSFLMPEWFLEDVTGDSRYQNCNMIFS